MIDRIILAIDPGATESAYVMAREDMKPIKKGKVPNETMLQLIEREWYTELVIERIAGYGMAVGDEVFETCVWTGRFIQASYSGTKARITRKDVKLHLCGQTRAKDGNVRISLMDRFGDKGTKKNPGWFYEFKDDIWAAYAVLVTYCDTVGIGGH